MNHVKTFISLLLPVYLVACSSTGGHTGYQTTKTAESVSIEVVPSFNLSSARKSIFGQCVEQNDSRVVSNFSRSFYANLSTMAKQRGVTIRGIGEAKNDVVVLLKINADAARDNVKTSSESYAINKKGRVSRSVRRKGTAVAFRETVPSRSETCQLVTGDLPSSFSQQINVSAQQLAKTTLDAMVRKGMM